MFSVLLSVTSVMLRAFQNVKNHENRTKGLGVIISVHLPHLGNLLPVLLAATDEDGGREKNNEHVTNMEKVDTET